MQSVFLVLEICLFFPPLPLDVLIVVCRWYQHVSTICNLKHCSLTNSMGGISEAQSPTNGTSLGTDSDSDCTHFKYDSHFPPNLL